MAGKALAWLGCVEVISEPDEEEDSANIAPPSDAPGRPYVWFATNHSTGIATVYADVTFDEDMYSMYSDALVASVMQPDYSQSKPYDWL